MPLFFSEEPVITVKALPDKFRDRIKFPAPENYKEKERLDLLKKLEFSRAQVAINKIDKEYLDIEEALKVSKGNKTKAAAILGFSRPTFYKKLKEYNINIENILHGLQNL